MNKVHVIVNPMAAAGRTARRWKEIRELIRSSFKEFKYVFTEQPRQATTIARDLLQDGYDLIIGVGGDGTLNEICNGYFQGNDSPINDDAAIALIPSGTGSDFFRSQHIPRDFISTITRINSRFERRVDIGKINFIKSGQARYFVNVADCGLGAEVIRTVSGHPARKKSKSTYLLALLKTLLSYNSQQLKLEFNGHSYEDDFLIAAIANNSTFGGGMVIAPDACIDDGFLNLTLVRNISKFEIIKNIPALYNGTITKNARVESFLLKKALISSKKPFPLELDGELVEDSPFEVSIVSKALLMRI